MTGQLQGAARFSSNDYVALGEAPQLPTAGEISISAWVSPGAVNGLRNIVAHGYTVEPSLGEVFLRINEGAYQVGSWNGTNHLASFSVPADDIGKWTHLVGLYDGSAWRLFRNGVEVAAKLDATGAVPAADDWAIGARGEGTSRFFQGDIDEVRIYNRDLNAEEIALLAAQGGHAPQASPRTLALPASLLGGQSIGSIPFTDIRNEVTEDDVAKFETW